MSRVKKVLSFAVSTGCCGGLTLCAYSFVVASGQGSYEGEVLLGLYHGKGKMKYKGGGSYQGNWVFGIWYGQGTSISGNVSNTSDWVGAFRNGQTVKKLPNGSCFEGIACYGYFARGKWTFCNGDVYEGQVDSACLPHGLGRLTCEETIQDRVGSFAGLSSKYGMYYEGDWVRGKQENGMFIIKHAHGEYTEIPVRTGLVLKQGHVTKDARGNVITTNASFAVPALQDLSMYQKKI